MYMHIFVFGNPDLLMDSLPIRLIPQLQPLFPDVEFVTLDPNEEWDIPRHMIIIDTVVGITEVTVFTNLDTFIRAPRITCHDFDAYANLLLMKKLGKIDGVTIVGVPAGADENVLPHVINTIHTVYIQPTGN